MAKIGLKYPVCAIATETASAITYANGILLGKAMKANVDIETNDTKLYADDAVCESDTSFKNGKIGIGVDDLTSTAYSYILGHKDGATVADGTGTTKETIANANDIAPYLGFGFYGAVMRNGVKKFRALWIKKVKFSEPKEELETKGESVSFKTPEIEGIIFDDVNDDWKIEATFSNEASAVNWLNGKAQITAKCLTPASSVPSGTYATAQSVVLTTAETGGTPKIYYTQDGTIPSVTNGTLYSTAIALATGANKCIKAVTTNTGKADSDILELYIKVS